MPYAHAPWRNFQQEAFDAILGRTVINLAVHKNGKISTSRGAGAPGPAYMAQVGAKVLYLFGDTLGEVVTVETAIIEAMEAPHTSKTTTADDVNGLSLQIVPRRMRKRKWRQISKTS